MVKANKQASNFIILRNFVKNELEFCILEDQVANIFTKPQKSDVIEKLKIMFGVIEFIARFKGGC